MAAWLKENWFKLGILMLLSGVASFVAHYYLGSFSPMGDKEKSILAKADYDIKFAKEDLELQAMCSKKAEEIFKEYSPPRDGNFPSYACHYNHKLKKCFVEIENRFMSSEKFWSNEVSLYDAYESKNYAEYDQVTGEGSAQLMACNCLDQPCNSRDEYDKLVKPYMQE